MDMTINMEVSEHARTVIDAGGFRRVGVSHDVLDRLTGLVEECGTQVAAAERLGISVPYLNGVLLGRDPVSPALASRIGFRAVTFYLE